MLVALMHEYHRHSPEVPAREVWSRHHEAGEEVEEAIEGARQDGGHHEVGRERHACDPKVSCTLQDAALSRL